MRTGGRLLVAVGAALAAAVAGGCRKKPPPTPEIEAPPVESPLKLVSIEPRVVLPDTAAQVTVYGSGFDRQTVLSVGDQTVSSTTYVNDNQLEVTLPRLPPGTYDLVASSAAVGARDVLRGGLVVERTDTTTACEFVVLYFETDRSELNRAAEDTLTSILDCYGQRPDPIRVEGHADERGTVDYNLALSYRRALAVQAFLTGAGLPRDRLPVSSFGEERPASTGWGDAAWAQNRRVELIFDLR
jgi:peptidoglycan-associated lipoprotein